MDEEAVPKLTVFICEIAFLLVLFAIFNQLIGNLFVSISTSLILVSLVTTFLAFHETIGLTIMVFIFSFVFIAIIFGSMMTGLFASSILLAVFVLINMLSH